MSLFSNFLIATYSGYAIVTILFLLSIFQLCLIFKLPFGDYAWGGNHKILPDYLRISSLSSIFIYVGIILAIISKTGTLQLFPQGQVLDIFTKVTAIYFTLGIPLNLISKNKKERYTMTPIVTALAILTWLVVLIK